jgi:putative transcriptional regulator
LKWSQADLASWLGVSRQTVNALEAGRWEPSLRLALKIAKVFGRSVEEVFLAAESGDQELEPSPRPQEGESSAEPSA